MQTVVFIISSISLYLYYLFISLYLFIGQEVERINIKSSEVYKLTIAIKLLVIGRKAKMHFFITAIKICHTHIRPTQTSENIFSVDSLNFVIKELGGQPNPRERRVLPHGIYCDVLQGMVFEHAVKSGIGYRNQRAILVQGGIWEVQFSTVSKIQLNQEYSLGFPGSHRHITTRKISQEPAGLCFF